MLKWACGRLLLLLIAFNCLAVIARGHRHRHMRSHQQPSDTNLFSPCTLPSVTNDSFEPICAANLKKRFICMLPMSTLLPVTLWTYLEEIIAGRFAFCRYDSLRKSAQREPIGDEELLKQWQRMESARLERLREAQRDQQQLQVREHRPEPVNIRPIMMRPTFSLTILDSYNRNELLNHRECGFRLPAAMKNGKASDIQLLFDYYANVTRHKWATSTCHTDIAVLIVGNPEFPNQADPPMILRVALSERFHHIMGEHVTEIVNELSNRYKNLSQFKDLLYFLLQNLVAVLESEYPVGSAPIQHTVPTWAICAFIGCILLSAAAAFIGNCVTNRGGQRSSSHGKIPGVSRSWRAGFSGGMWGAS